MSGFKEYAHYDAIGLAQLVRDKHVTPAELLHEAISRATRINPKINAIINPLYKQAKQAQAHLPSGIFSGVPFLLKDLLGDLKGIPTSNGSSAYEGLVPTEDSTLVHRFKQSGVNIFGKTNTPELGLMAITEPKAFGITRNPWDTKRTPGGSSGGSAAAVAARIVPMASAGDGGGSIRIPASHCGLFGLKPTRGRNPSGPNHGEHWDGATCEHVLTRSVRDSAAMLDITNGSEPGSPYIINAPQGSYLNGLAVPPKKLRIGFSTQSPYGGKVDAECLKAVEKAVLLLQDLGHEVEEKTPDFNGHMLLDSYLTTYFGHTAAEAAYLKSVLGNKAVHKLEDSTRLLALLGECLSAGDFVRAKDNWFKITKAMDIYHQSFDLFMTPSTASLAVPVGSLEMASMQRIQTKFANALGPGIVRLFKKSLLAITTEEARKHGDKTPFTQLANITGQPAMSVPLHWSHDGLPCGVQFVAPFGDEMTLFKLAAQLEQAQPWADKVPNLVVTP
jgi:amidase